MEDLDQITGLCIHVAHDLTILKREEIGVETDNIEVFAKILKDGFNVEISYVKDKESQNIYICRLKK